MADLDQVLDEELDAVGQAEAAIMELSEDLPDDFSNEGEPVSQQTEQAAEESFDDRVARLERENEELRRHEAGLRSGLIENRQRAAAMQQERDALFESLSNIDQRLAERQQAPVQDGWLDDDADATPAAQGPDPQTAQVLYEMRNRLAQEDAEKAIRSTVSQVVNTTLQAESDFRNQNQDLDYDGAVEYAEQYHLRQLTAQGWDETAARRALDEQKLRAAYDVLSVGQNPAQALVNYARSLGWEQGGDAPAAQTPSRARPPKTIANTGRPPVKANTDNSLANMWKTDPAKFRRIAADPEAWAEYERRIALSSGISQADS
jgi:hypothetical protein